MEPRIQYAKTSDGVSIAYAVTGRGAPLVLLPGQISHIQLAWQHPQARRWLERLAEKRMIVQYDGRGSGLSERAINRFSVDSLVLDLGAVVDAVGPERFALAALGWYGMGAVAYTVRHAERVSRLILAGCWARGADFWSLSRTQAMRAVRETDWELYTAAVIHLSGVRASKQLEQFLTAFVREAISPETLKAFMDASQGFDVADLLPQVKCPTLVLHQRQAPFPPVDFSKRLASEIPHARLLLVESVFPLLGNMEEMLTAVDEFLGEGETVASATAAVEAGAFRTILFTDIEGSTAMTQRLGDAKAREVLREHERITRECLRTHGGSEVKTMGDGFMASFGSATKALECAIAIQRAFAARNASLPAHPEALEARPERSRRGRAKPQPSAHASTGSARADRGVSASPASETIRVRIGLNAGEPIAEDDPDGRGDLFGTAVIRAARIAAMAHGGEILVANVVRELAEGKGFLFGDRGEVALRGFDDPVHLFEVRWQD